MKTKYIKLLMFSVFTAFLLGGVTLAADITNEVTGSNSVNKVIISAESNTKVEIENNAGITNEIDLNINTGDNSTSGNTGDGSISTGDIDASISVTNEVNYCSINGDDIDDPDEDGSVTTTTTKPTTTVVTTPTGGTITITTTGTGVSIYTRGYSGNFSTTFSGSGTEQSFAQPEEENSSEVIALSDDDIKGVETQNVLIGDEKNCPWCIGIVIALAVILGGYGFYLSKAKNPKGILMYWYLWPAVLGYLAWVVHTLAHYGTGIGWFADGYDKVIIAEIIISYLAYYAILVKHEQKIHKPV